MVPEINFFWSGNNFTYLNYLCIQSHINIGHSVRIHIHGNLPNSVHWNALDINKINILNADDVFDITEFLKQKNTNIKTGSALWRFHYLYKHGGWYSDTDAIALKKWDINSNWMLCSGETDSRLISIGVIKVPKNQKMFLYMIRNISPEWGNVRIFTNYYRKFNNCSKHIYDSELFYPIKWNEYMKILRDIKIPDVYSLHTYNTMFERDGIINDIQDKIQSGSLLERIVNFVENKKDRFTYFV